MDIKNSEIIVIDGIFLSVLKTLIIYIIVRDGQSINAMSLQYQL